GAASSSPERETKNSPLPFSSMSTGGPGVSASSLVKTAGRAACSGRNCSMAAGGVRRNWNEGGGFAGLLSALKKSFPPDAGDSVPGLVGGSVAGDPELSRGGVTIPRESGLASG